MRKAQPAACQVSSSASKTVEFMVSRVFLQGLFKLISHTAPKPIVFNSHCQINHISIRSVLRGHGRMRYKVSMTPRALVGLVIVNLTRGAQDGSLHLVI